MAPSAVRRRLEDLTRAYGFTPEQGEQLDALLAVLERDARAPTTVRAPEAAVDAHLADSLVALELEAVGGARTIVDLGSGAGFPGLPVAVALPHCEIRLLESQRRKCAFLENVAAELGIANATVVCERAEAWVPGRAANDVVLARAVGPQPVVLEYAAPLLRLGGILVDWRGRRMPEEEQRAARAARDLGLELGELRPVRPFERARDRHLHVFTKVGETPERFPRRPGMARKRQLGG
ncbi:MAG TPA: 16S rRNA (guanine(527)-N(7))-methyltransferase RsmG [Solirubrobacteraceae bacterium]|nr:16S rRNA (guanine(527)-N(7))-methyltransferase RsmG [Solirubrobacteraceae bacterium]